MSAQDDKDYQDYLDEQEYKQYSASQAAPAANDGGGREIPSFNAPKELLKATWGALHDPYVGRDKPGTDDEIAAYNQSHTMGAPPLAIPAAALPAKVAQLAELLNSSGPRRIAMGGVQGAITDPEHPIRGAAKGAIFSALGEGANKSADWLMQKAVGLRRYAPGLGNKFVDEGLAGTRGMMEGQSARNMGDAVDTMQSAAEDIPHLISSDPASKNILELAEQRSLPIPGSPEPSNAKEQVDRILSRAGEAEARGPVPAQNAWQYGKISGKLGYGRTGEPLNNLEAQINQAEQAGYSKALQAASPEFAQGAQQYSTNATANQSLSKDPGIGGSNLIDALLSASGLKSVVPSAGAQALQKGSLPLRDALLRQQLLDKTPQ